MYQFGDKTYKYRTFWEAQAKTIPAQPKEKQQLAVASLNNLIGIFDNEVKERIRQNPDLLGVCSNLILANAENLNGDCVLFEDLLPVAEKFEYKFYDIEHDRSRLIGVIDETGWAAYPSNELIGDDELTNYRGEGPQLVVGGYLWRIIDEDLCNAIEGAANENSPNYKEISKSFELLFDDYWICVSPNQWATSQGARFIKSSDEEYDKYDKMLRVNGGSGRNGGSHIFRVLKGDILPVGAGIVKKPASGLKGIAVIDREEMIAEHQKELEEGLKKHLDASNNFESRNIKVGDFVNIKNNRGGDKNYWEIASIEDDKVNLYYPSKPDIFSFDKSEIIKYKDGYGTSFSENSINEEKNSVKENKSQQTEIIMVIAKLEDIETQFESFTKLPAKEATASIQKLMEAKISELVEKHASEVKVKEDEAKAALTAKAELEERAANLGKAVEDLQNKLGKIEQAQAQATAEAKFNERMASLEETFDLEGEDDVRVLLVEEVKSITSDESFASFMDKKKKLMKEKTKSYKKDKAECMKDKMAKAGVQVTVDEKTLDFKEVFASVKPVEGETKIPNGASAAEDLKTKFAKAFSEGIEVAGLKTDKKE
jgi:hypothetical protein